MEALFVIGVTFVIFLAILNIGCFILSLFGGDNLVERRKRGNNP